MPFAARPLTDATLRANPDLRFVPARALRRVGWNAQSSGDPAFVGALLPSHRRWIGVRAVDQTAAALFTSVRRPRRVPRRFIDGLGSEASRTLAALVLDGVLEIDDGSRFVTGADAHSLVVRGVARTSRGLTSRLSLDALRYGAALPIEDVDRLALRLYAYNRAPATPALRRRFPTQRAVELFLRFSKDGEVRRVLDSAWRGEKGTGVVDNWRFWTPRSIRRPLRRCGLTFKIFVSPTTLATPDAVEAVARALAGPNAPQFKVGTGLYGLLRPDKIVLYFGSKRELSTTAATLTQALRGIPVQGVPFSADLGLSGLMSWGIDPESESLPLANRGSESWRVWVTSRLARSLLIARHSERRAPADAAQFALDRLALAGVNPETWAPPEAGEW